MRHFREHGKILFVLFSFCNKRLLYVLLGYIYDWRFTFRYRRAIITIANVTTTKISKTNTKANFKLLHQVDGFECFVNTYYSALW